MSLSKPTKPKDFEYRRRDLQYDPIVDMVFGRDVDGTASKWFKKMSKSNLNEIIAYISVDTNLYEVICPNLPVQIYFDLELKDPPRDKGTQTPHRYGDKPFTKEEFDEKDRKTTQFMVKTLTYLLHDFYKKTVQESDWCVLNSCRDGKYSTHVILVNGFYAKNIKEAKRFAIHVSNFIKNFAQKKPEYAYLVQGNKTIVDTVVYSSHQLLRLANQSKFGSNSPLRIITTHELAQTFIAFFNTVGRVMLDETTNPIEPDKPNDVAPHAQTNNTDKRAKRESDALKKINKGERFISDDMIATTGLSLFEVKNMTYQQLHEMPEWLRLLHLIKPQSVYQVWLATCIANHYSGGTAEAFKEFSLLIPADYKAGDENVIDKVEYREMTFKIGTLRYFAKVSNPEHFAKVRDCVMDSYFSVCFDDVTRIVENTRFLSTNADGTRNNNANIETKFEILMGFPGIGKSTEMLHAIKGHKRVLFVCSRVSFGYYLSKMFNTVFYQDDHASFSQFDRLTIQANSIQKWLSANVYYDCVVIDEIEALLKHMSCPTMHGIAEKVFMLIIQIIQKCRKVIFADAYLKQRTMDFAKFCVEYAEGKAVTNFKQHITVLQNTYIREDRTKAIQLEHNESINKIMEFLNDGLNVYVTVCLKEIGDKIYELVKTIIPECDILYYSSDSSAETMKTINDIEKHWGTKRLVMVTPTITHGVSHHDPLTLHFHYTVAITSNMGCTAGEVMQQILRVRLLKNNTIFFSTNDQRMTFGAEDITSGVDEKHNIRRMTFQDSVETNLRKYTGEVLEDMMDDAKEAFVKSYFSNKLMKSNAHEEALSKMNFTQMFIEYMKQTGFEITLLEKTKPNEPAPTVKVVNETPTKTDLQKYTEIKVIDNANFNKNNEIIKKKGANLKNAKLENFKFMFNHYTNSEVSNDVKAKLFFDIWKIEKSEKCDYLTNVYGEINGNAKKMTNGEVTASKIEHIKALNVLLGINGSYDNTTEISRNNLIGTKDYLQANWDKLKVFDYMKKKVFPVDDKSFNQSLFYTIAGIYNEFNGNTLITINKDETNRRSRNAIKYRFDGFDLGHCVKRNPHNANDLENALNEI